MSRPPDRWDEGDLSEVGNGENSNTRTNSGSKCRKMRLSNLERRHKARRCCTAMKAAATQRGRTVGACLAAVDGWIWVVEKKQPCTTRGEGCDIAQQERETSAERAQTKGANAGWKRGCERLRLLGSRGRDLSVGGLCSCGLDVSYCRVKTTCMGWDGMAEAAAAGRRPINGARREAWIDVRAAERGKRRCCWCRCRSLQLWYRLEAQDRGLDMNTIT